MREDEREEKLQERKKLTKQCKVLNGRINRNIVMYLNPGAGLDLRGQPGSNQEPVKHVWADAIEGVICHPSFVDVQVAVVYGYEFSFVVCGIDVPPVAVHFNSEPAGTDAVRSVVFFGIVPAH